MPGVSAHHRADRDEFCFHCIKVTVAHRVSREGIPRAHCKLLADTLLWILVFFLELYLLKKYSDTFCDNLPYNALQSAYSIVISTHEYS